MESLFLFEGSLRLGVFLTLLALFIAWEMLAPRRPLSQKRSLRWTGNIGLSVINVVFLRLLFPLGAVGVAFFAEQNSWGLFHHLPIHPLVAGILAFLILDITIYFQHIIFHHVPLLWRLHRVHHADLDLDVTSGARFHPLEILLSMLIKIAAILLLGISPLVVILFEIVLNGTSMFNHSNLKIPTSVDRWLRYFIVTPDMHRIHHSVYPEETNRNFGFNVPWWDWLFRTYLADPRDGHERMNIGLEYFRDSEELKLTQMLKQPFRRG